MINYMLHSIMRAVWSKSTETI